MSGTINHKEFMNSMKKREEWRAEHPFRAWLTDIPKYPRRLWNYYSDAVDYIWDFFQRGYRGWATRDAWSWTYHNTKVQIQVLKHLRDNNNGYPADIAKNKHWRIQEAEWKIILDKIINAFELIEKDMNCDLFNFGRDVKKEVIERCEKDGHKVMTNKQQDEIEEGLQLYVKYYRNLWD